ncbi:MAG: hypothetical protein GY765_23775 [bacterium]|nr:hypothetical protein [bacterium]
MKNKKYLILIVFLLLAACLPGHAETPADDHEGVRLTWQDLQQLLDIKSDKLKLTWNEFQKLLEQSGSRIDMNYRVTDGIVTIKREQFRQILNRMKPPAAKPAAPPNRYLVTEAHYTGTAGKNNCRFTARFKVYVFESESPTYLPIPVLSTRTAVSDISVDGLPGVMRVKGGWYTIHLDKSGYHDIRAVFSVDKEKQSLSFPIIRAMINTIDFGLPFKNYEIAIPSALNMRIPGASRQGRGIAHMAGNMAASRVTAHLPPTNRLAVKWTAKRKKKIKKPALFYASTHVLVSAAPDILKVTTQIELEVLQSGLNRISIRLPANGGKEPDRHEVVKVTGLSIKNWQVRDTGIGKVLEIHLGFDVTRRCQFTVFTEQMLAGNTLGVAFKGLKVLDARRESGAIAVVAQSAVEVDVRTGQQLEKLDFHQLPQKLTAMTSRPILYSYKYSRHPYNLDIALHKHEQLEGISTVIESAVGTALFLRDGKMLHKMEYTLRNSYKQFMELELPPDASIWTVIVDNKREKASRNKKGKVLIPLVRSSGNGDLLKAFKVQLIYTRPFEQFSVKGGNRFFFPKTDIFINKIRMEMYLPEGYSYSFDKGEWKEVVPAPVRGKAVACDKETEDVKRKDHHKRNETVQLGAVAGKPAASAPAEKRKSEAEKLNKQDVRIYTADELKEADIVVGKIALPVSRVEEKGKKRKRALTGPVGLNSISVNLPISGTKYVFSKAIIDKDETYPMAFSYVHRGALRAVYLLLGILALLIFVIYIYKRIKRLRPGAVAGV